jgi:hypothetical protein
MENMDFHVWFVGGNNILLPPTNPTWIIHCFSGLQDTEMQMDHHECVGQRDSLERWLHVKEEEHEDMLTEQIRADLYKKMDGPPAPVPTPVRSDRLPAELTPASGNAPADGVPQ